jgi:hypothetical protein
MAGSGRHVDGIVAQYSRVGARRFRVSCTQLGSSMQNVVEIGNFREARSELAIIVFPCLVAGKQIS